MLKEIIKDVGLLALGIITGAVLFCAFQLVTVGDKLDRLILKQAHFENEIYEDLRRKFLQDMEQYKYTGK